MWKKWKAAVNAFEGCSMRKKLKIFRNACLIPFILLIIWMICMMFSFNAKYSKTINNVAVATEFNQDFRNQIDYKIYRIVAGAVTFDEVKPYEDIEEARRILMRLKGAASTQNSVDRVDAILRLSDRLEKTIKCIENGTPIIGRRDNREILDKDIYQLTELIDVKIADYIRYEAEHANIMKLYLEKQIKNSIKLISFITLMIVVLILILTRHISQSIEKPVRELCDSTQKVAEGNFDIQVQVHPMEEMEVLGNSFNIMVEKIGSLVQDMKKEQVHLRKTELKLLQAQINPHFLYNTLDTIIWLAEDKQNEQVVQMVDQLSIFFRTTLSKGQDFITLQEEESHVRSYLEIQQFRYSDIMEYEVLMDKEIINYYILKICLQPLVENALYHGIKNKRGKGKLTVRGWKDGEYLHFSVEDTGKGMTEEELKTLNTQIGGDYSSDNRSGFGLLNVNERLCLTYGEECKLQIHSEYDVGTVVSFQIPAREERTI